MYEQLAQYVNILSHGLHKYEHGNKDQTEGLIPTLSCFFIQGLLNVKFMISPSHRKCYLQRKCVNL